MAATPVPITAAENIRHQVGPATPVQVRNSANNFVAITEGEVEFAVAVEIARQGDAITAI